MSVGPPGEPRSSWSVGTVITGNAARQVLSPGAVAIDGDDIVEVGTPRRDRRKYRGAETIDARDQIVLPGLINTHTHAPMVLYRGLADDLALMDWLQKYIFPGGSQDVSPEFVRDRHAAGRARDDRVGHDDLRRHVLLRGGDRAGDQGSRPARRARADDHPVSGGRREDAGRRLWRAPRRFIKDFKGDSLIVPAVAPHALYTLDAATL